MEKPATLFDNFDYGMSRKEIEQRLRISAATEGGGDRQTLRAPSAVDFLHEKWELIFFFANDDGLRQIILMRIAQAVDDYLLLQKALMEKSWLPVAVETEDAAFDVFDCKDSDNLEARQKALADFEKDVIRDGKGITVYFFPSTFAEKILQNSKIKFWANAVDKAPENFCLLSLMADRDNIKLSFTAPLLSRKAALKYGEKIRR